MLTVLAFLVTCVIIIGVHELGHYTAARMMGVRVMAFSIGFGWPIWRHIDRHGTEWRFGAIPLGGYVLMLNNPTEAAKCNEPPERSLEGINRWRRAWVIFAGPLANFVLSVVLFYGAAIIGEQGLRARIGRVIPDSPAVHAGLVPGDEIVAVDERPMVMWSKVYENLLFTVGDHDARLRVSAASGVHREVVLPTGPPYGTALLDKDNLLDELGIVPDRSFITLELATIIDNSPAAAAGLQVGDTMLAAGDVLVEDWAALVAIIQAHAGVELPLMVERSGELVEVTAVPQPRPNDQGGRGYLGVVPRFDAGRFQSLLAHERAGPIEALGQAVVRTARASAAVLRFLGLMVVGDVSTKNLSGPVGIASQSGTAASLGLVVFLSFVAQLSISLGLINLLPIPLLDGSHLLRYGIEGVLRRPLPSKIVNLAGWVGACLLLALTVFTIYNDLV